jgi:hypothetical protein
LQGAVAVVEQMLVTMALVAVVLAVSALPQDFLLLLVQLIPLLWVLVAMAASVVARQSI